MSHNKQTSLVEGALSITDVVRNVDEAKGYQAALAAARKHNDLPPKSSNWYVWAKKNKLGVMDLDDLATDAGHKDFTHMDSAISPKDAMLKPRFAAAYAKLKESAPSIGLTLDEGKDYYRLPDKVRDNEFYEIRNDLKNMYDALRKGSDFNMRDWQDLKKSMAAIEKAVQKNPPKP